ncbi:MAG: (2Fe-2S)-binding protein, partial [Mangrovicoccus sp.]
GTEAGGAVLAARPGEDQPDQGGIVCACFDVGVNTIIEAIESKGLRDVEAIGDAIRAGTNCGSCRPEIRGILDAHTPKEAAE